MEAEVSLGMGIAVDKQEMCTPRSWPAEVRRSSKADGTISLYAGTGYCSGGGDGGAATMASLCSPGGLRSTDPAASISPSPAVERYARSLPSAERPRRPHQPRRRDLYRIAERDDYGYDAERDDYYTTDGTAPTIGSTGVSGAIAVTQSETLEAIAGATGYLTTRLPRPLTPSRLLLRRLQGHMRCRRPTRR